MGGPINSLFMFNVYDQSEPKREKIEKKYFFIKILKIMDLGPYSQHFVFFVTYACTNKIEFLLLARLSAMCYVTL
jgi:hypothetical protein